MKIRASIKNWAQDDRPREKLLLKGPETLSNSELLAILIQNGHKEKSALEVARDVLALAKDDLNDLGRLSVKEMSKVKGIGPAKAVIIAAALELSRRRQDFKATQKPIIQSSNEAFIFLKDRFKDYSYEAFGILLLNNASRLIHFEEISKGGITATLADPRIIFKLALEHGATSIILVHNHPSGHVKPSRQDEQLTKVLKDAGNIMQIKIADHIIIGNETYFSFAEEGTLF